MRIVQPDESELEALARDCWESSGLTKELACKLRLQALTAKEVQAKLGVETDQARGLLFPYFDLQGKPTDFFRIRYLETLPGFKGEVQKPQRYVQKAGTLNEIYFPPLLKRNWADMAADSSTPLMITEGEKKAAAACAAGFPCLGLGGVDVWQSKKHRVPLLDPLPTFAWTGRRANIAFDSDAAENPNVVRAQLTLARALTELGAVVHLLAIPVGPNNAKQGIDDFLLAQGKEGLQAAVDAAEAFGLGEALWKMNEELMFIRDPGIVVVRYTGQRMTVRQAIQANFANRMHVEYQPAADGSVKAKKVRTALAWTEWPKRAEVHRIVYRPGCAQVVDDGFNFWPGWGCEPKKGDIGPFEKILDVIFGKEDVARRWWLQQQAYPLQYPGTKLFNTSLIWGREHGTGKTLVAYALMRIYGKNAIEIKNRHLRNGFNSWQENRQFVYGDEIAGAQDMSSKKIDAEWLKGLITQSHVTINQKHIPEYTIVDCMNYFFTSNRPDAVFLEDTDRRFFIQEVQGRKLTEEFYRTADEWLHGEGPAALFAYLLDFGLEGFNPNGAALVTKSKAEMSYIGKSDMASWIAQLAEDPERALLALGDRVAQGCQLFTADDLVRAYSPGDHKRISTTWMARDLISAGFNRINGGTPVRTVLGSKRLYVVRGEWSDKTLAQAGQHYSRYFGKDSGKC